MRRFRLSVSLLVVGALVVVAASCGRSASSTAPPATSSADLATGTSPAADPALAWAVQRLTLPQPEVETTIVAANGTPTIATGQTGDLGSPGSFSLVVWPFEDNQWHQALVVPLDAPLLKNGGLITTEVTGDGQPDFIWATPAADQVVNGVVSSDGGAWQSVAFGTNLMVDTLTVSGGILTSSEMTCDPNCAEGGTIDTSWRYDRASRTFIGTDITPTTTRPPSPACTANAIANAVRESPDVGAVVTFSVQDLICDGQWAFANLVNPKTADGYLTDNASVFLQASGSNWVLKELSTIGLCYAGVPKAVLDRHGLVAGTLSGSDC